MIDSITRLQLLKVDNELVRLEMQAEAGRFAALASRHIDGTAPQAVSAFNLFQTPPEIAARMAELTGNASRILEPSAGLGRIYKALRTAQPAAEICLVEQSPDCVKELYRLTEIDKQATLKQADFLEVKPASEGNAAIILKDLPFAFFDAVVMNPPFERGRDIKHILHALKFLHNGGLLVALCYNGVRQNKELKPLATTWEVLPEGSFQSEGTRASVVLLTIKKG